MDRGVTELQAAVETTDFALKEVRPALRAGNHAVYKPETSQSCPAARNQRISKIAIEKLNDLFDFQHFLRGPGSDHVPSSIEVAQVYTHQKSKRCEDDDQGYEPLESCCSAGSNVLGIPPPRSDDIHALAGPHKSLHVYPVLMTQEHHLLLHDLISGDIYED